MTHIYLDAMGGDNAPNCTVEGAMEALRADKDLKITLGGPVSEIEPLLQDAGDVRDRIALDDAPEIITNHDAPVMAIRQKKNSAQVRGMLMVKEKQADAFVSAGSTGATLAGGMFRLGRIDGVERPALAPLLPNGKGFFCLIDCGANVDCLPQYLPQFGVMGEAYMRCVQGVEKPRVGLVNIGAEAEKGNALVKAAYPLMESAPFHFVGNIEGRDITADQADVIVCDGFSGNLIMKFMEGVAETLMGIIKSEIYADARGKIGGIIAKPAFRRVKKRMDYTEVGGAPLLGVKGVVIKAHGSSNGHAIASAIKQAALMARKGLVDAIESEIAKQLNQ
ncbi:MAG: phosphate acyltransferase PlsX [Clostridiales bacterium]|nr:phosphate acyltransferase PlsX [Clostridiales bacterium]